MATLKEFLGSKPITTIDVERVEQELNSEGEKIALLFLATPIPEVVGSQSVNDGEGKTMRISAYDVTTIRVHERFFDVISIPDEGKGVITTDLRLDVAKKSGEVYITDESFAMFGRNRTRERNQENEAGVLQRMLDRRTKATFKGGAKEEPEPVVTDTSKGVKDKDKVKVK